MVADHGVITDYLCEQARAAESLDVLQAILDVANTRLPAGSDLDSVRSCCEEVRLEHGWAEELKDLDQ